MIGFIVALKKEAESVINEIINLKETSLNEKTIYQGKLFGKDIVLMISGIGKVSASLSAQYLIDNYPITTLINFGSAGGVNNSVKIGEYYQITKCCQPDFDVTEIDEVDIGYIQEYDRVYFEPNKKLLDGFEKKTLATTDKFCSTKNFITLLNEMNCDIRDMEGCAIAQVCTTNDIPLIIIKGITDIYGSNNDGEQFLNNLVKVSSNFPLVVKKIFSLI